MALRYIFSSLINRAICWFGSSLVSPLFFGLAMGSYAKGKFPEARREIGRHLRWDASGNTSLLAHVILGISCAETRDMISAKTAVGTAYDLYLHGAVVPRGWEQDVALAFDMLAAFLRQSGEQDKIEAIQRAADKVRFPHSKIEARG